MGKNRGIGSPSQTSSSFSGCKDTRFLRKVQYLKICIPPNPHL